MSDQPDTTQEVFRVSGHTREEWREIPHHFATTFGYDICGFCMMNERFPIHAPEPGMVAIEHYHVEWVKR